MSLHLDHKYLNLLSSRLASFSWKSGKLANCKCNICHEGKSKKKKRMFFFDRDDGLWVHCHNCSYSTSFQKYLQEIDQYLYNQYKVERFNPTKEDFKPIETYAGHFNVEPGTLKLLQKVSSLPADHECLQYVKKRKIPTKYYDELFYCPNFMSWVNKSIPNKFDKYALKYDAARLLLPFMHSGIMIAATGRALSPNDERKYILIRFNEEYPPIYGLNRVDDNRWVNVLEGPIDSLFLENSIAVCCGDLTHNMNFLPRERLRLIFDNEPRSKDLRHNMMKAIRHDFSVVVWPKNIEPKDINAMVDGGLSINELEVIIEKNTYRGLAAEAALSNWSKA